MKALLGRKSAEVLFRWGKVVLQWAPLAITFLPSESVLSTVKRILKRVPISVAEKTIER